MVSYLLQLKSETFMQLIKSIDSDNLFVHLTKDEIEVIVYRLELVHRLGTVLPVEAKEGSLQAFLMAKEIRSVMSYCDPNQTSLQL